MTVITPLICPRCGRTVKTLWGSANSDVTRCADCARKERGGHSTEVNYQRAWHEYRAECSCGWVGSYFESRVLAEREADQHRQS